MSYGWQAKLKNLQQFFSGCPKKFNDSLLLPPPTGRHFHVTSGAAFALGRSMSAPKCVVYVLKSEASPLRYYTGLTSNLAARLEAHNAGNCRHTASGRPWRIDVAVEFADEGRAIAFERYLKSGSGSAFAQRHLR